jgi:hypothetical protein
MYNKDNPNYKLYLAGIITENQYYEMLEGEPSNPKVIIYTDQRYRGADADSDDMKVLPANAALPLSDLTMWEDGKNLNDKKIADWVNDTLIPELQKNGSLKPLIVWHNKQDNKKYVVDGNHRFLAYQKANFKGQIPIVIVPDDEVLVSNWYPGSPEPKPELK